MHRSPRGSRVLSASWFQAIQEFGQHSNYGLRLFLVHPVAGALHVLDACVGEMLRAAVGERIGETEERRQKLATAAGDLIATRTSWLFARMLTLDDQALPTDETLAHWKAAGMDQPIYAKRAAERPFNFADIVYPMPLGFRRIKEGDQITIGGRDWDIHIGNGHAPEHATFWSKDCSLVLAGDQMLPSISSNIGVYATEPEADPVGDWLESCERLKHHAREDHLVLGGHKLPFTGLPVRMRQLIDNHHGALERLVAHLDTPKTAAECFQPLFKRKIDEGTYGLALVESLAHLNHLFHLGDITRTRRDDGAWVWQTARR